MGYDGLGGGVDPLSLQEMMLGLQKVLVGTSGGVEPSRPGMVPPPLRWGQAFVEEVSDQVVDVVDLRRALPQ